MSKSKVNECLTKFMVTRYDSRIKLEPERNKDFGKLPELPIINNNARILPMGAIMSFNQTRPRVIEGQVKV